MPLNVQNPCRIDSPSQTGEKFAQLARLVDARGTLLAWWWGGNFLRADPPPIPDPGTPLVLWSGWTGESAFERHPAAWAPPALSTFQDRLRALHAAHPSRQLLFRPHARHILNDPQRCAAFFTDSASLNAALALDPAALLEPSMLRNADDHLHRICERLVPLSRLVLVSGARLMTTDGEETLQPETDSHAEIPAERVAAVVSRFAELTTVIRLTT